MKFKSNYVSNSSSTSFVIRSDVEKKTFDNVMDKELCRHLNLCSKCNKFMINFMLCCETPSDFENTEIPFEQRYVPKSCEFYAEQFIAGMS